MSIKVFDNINEILKEDLEKVLKPLSKVSIVASNFSIFAYKELKQYLDKVDECRVIITTNSIDDFFIETRTDNNSYYSVNQPNDTLKKKYISKECIEWINNKVKFKFNKTGYYMDGFISIDNNEKIYTYLPVSGFTKVAMGCEKGRNIYNFVNRLESPNSSNYQKVFDDVWNDSSKVEDCTECIVDNLNSLVVENSPEYFYFTTLNYLFGDSIEESNSNLVANDASGYKDSKVWNLLYDFQRDAVLAIINKLEKYNGCILADSVGLGKTFTALAVIKYYENKNKSVLVLCPKKLSDNWNTYKDNYVNNPIADDRLNYDVLYHTDLSRNKGISNGIDLERINWGNYDLVVIDESHNFRNGASSNNFENRYTKLLNKVIKSGVQTKVLMLSATPVNNRFLDLKNQLALAYEGDSASFTKKLDTDKSIDDIFKQAQRTFNDWNKLGNELKTTDNLLSKLDNDFLELLDSVTIARSRKHIEKYYDTGDIGKFPERKPPISVRSKLTNLNSAINYSQIYEQLMLLSLCIYSPSNYIFPSKLEKYLESTHNKGVNLTQKGRESGIRKLMGINLLKRLESSVFSFKLTLNRIKHLINNTINSINDFEKYGCKNIDLYEVSENDFDLDDGNTDFFTVGKKVVIDLADLDYKTWREELNKDSEILELLSLMIDDITPEYDSKLQELFKIISNKIENPINKENNKVIIFSAFSDTANYLYENVSQFVKNKYGLDTAVITGTIDGKTTIKGFKATLNNVLTCFSPMSKGKHLLMPDSTDEIDILIATDCISEGQNLQDCDYLVNYDIHWNPVRIIQRFGRVDRIGSKNEFIQLVNFWPDIDLDEYINLKSRVETRMKISIMTSTGDDDLINSEEKGSLEYRTIQLKRLQDEVVDIEDMTNGISMMDLGLSEFRIELLEYQKHKANILKQTKGIYAVTSTRENLPPGLIFVLKKIDNIEDVDIQNRLHPYYLVYINNYGEVEFNYLQPKKILDNMRLLCKGKNKPIIELCELFNKETENGKNMTEIENLLDDAIYSIVDSKEESDIDSLFSPGGTTALMSEINGANNFELISFLVVR